MNDYPDKFGQPIELGDVVFDPYDIGVHVQQKRAFLYKIVSHHTVRETYWRLATYKYLGGHNRSLQCVFPTYNSRRFVKIPPELVDADKDAILLHLALLGIDFPPEVLPNDG